MHLGGVGSVVAILRGAFDALVASLPVWDGRSQPQGLLASLLPASTPAMSQPRTRKGKSGWGRAAFKRRRGRGSVLAGPGGGQEGSCRGKGV